MAEEYGPKGFSFVFLYTREAHPGENYPAHRSMEQKVGRGGTALFRCDWTDPPTVRSVLEYVLESRGRRREGLRLAPFYAEFAGYRWNDQEQCEKGPRWAGPQAVEDFRRAREARANAGPRPGAIVLES